MGSYHIKNELRSILSALSILAIVFMLQTQQAVFAEEPWWTMGFETTEEIQETSFSYNTDGSMTQKETLQGGQLQFEALTPRRLTDLSKEEQSIFQSLESLKKEDPKITDQSLVATLIQEFGHGQEEIIVNMLGYYEFTTQTGYFSYLNEKPKNEWVQIYDTWFDLYNENYPTPPQTVARLKTIENEVFQKLAEQFQLPISELRDIIYKIQKYQEKYNLPKNQKLSKSLNH